MIEIELPVAFGRLLEAQNTIIFGEGHTAFLDEYLIQGSRLGSDFVDRAENANGVTAR